MKLHHAALAAVFLVASTCVAQDVSDAESSSGQETEVKRLEPSSGPSTYYDGENFLLEVRPGFKLRVFRAESNGTTLVGSVTVDKAATPIKGSMVGSEVFSISIDWKSEEFSSGSLKVSNLMLKMMFNRDKKAWRLTAVEVARATVNGENTMNSKISPISINGYDVSAPIGLSYCCGNPGAFPPSKEGSNSANKYVLGLEMPGMKMQVYDVEKFGPAWYCGGTSIGLWVGIFVSLFFAFVCYMGFGMLANVQTMDRFDDPKGKPIHVPNTD